MQQMRRLPAAVALAVFGLIAVTSTAFAQVPYDWQMGMQHEHSPVQAAIRNLHGLVLVIITLITVFVAVMLVYVAFRFNRRRNPNPGRFSHNTPLEVAWTVVPVLILVVIAIPSFRLVYFEDRVRDADVTIKATGHQWNWEYTYPDNGNIDFESYYVGSDALKPGQKRLLDVDHQLVLPAGKNVRILTTSADVIHSFFIPSLGVQRYAIPGRTIETWVRIDQPGDYYGECNQICGTNHSAMPISVHAVTPEQFQAWLVEAKTKYANGAAPAEPRGEPIGEPRAETKVAQVVP